MTKPVFDFDDGRFLFPFSDTMGTGADGHLLLRLSDCCAMDLDAGGLHLLSGWDDDRDGRDDGWDD